MIKSNLPIDEAIYEHGYNQALEDNTLTWEDARDMVTAFFDVMTDNANGRIAESNTIATKKGLYSEVLRRFKEYKAKKEDDTR